MHRPWTSTASTACIELQGDYAAINFSQGSHGLDVAQSTLIGGEAGAVDAFGSHDVRIVGNEVDGALPENDPSTMVEVHDNSSL